jgi:hypothetical protein
MNPAPKKSVVASSESFVEEEEEKSAEKPLLDESPSVVPEESPVAVSVMSPTLNMGEPKEFAVSAVELELPADINPPAEEKTGRGSSQSSWGMESASNFEALEVLSGGLPILARGDDLSEGSVHSAKHVLVETGTEADPPEETQEEDGDCR